MYYILYEGLQIDPNEPVYCMPIWHTLYRLYSRPVRSDQFLILHIKYNTYLYFSIIYINNFFAYLVCSIGTTFILF